VQIPRLWPSSQKSGAANRRLRVVGAILVTIATGVGWPVTGSGVGFARAAGVEQLMVPSRAMGRDIPVSFVGGGAHAVYLLDAFDAGESVSNWITTGGAVNTLSGKGVSIVAPAGGAYSFYTDWEQDGSRQWETFLTSELPDWLSSVKGLDSSGHAIVGASQGGTAAIVLSEFHPDRFRYAASLSGFLYPSNTTVNGAITDGMMRFGGVDIRNMWGLPQLGRWKWHDPWVHAALLANNNTRVWVYSPRVSTASDPAAMIGYPDQAQGTNRDFYDQYRNVGAKNGHFDFPGTGDHGWSSWGPQLAAMAGNLIATIK
jgi:S-formylglutathione hydrolase FrmB